MIEMTKIPFEDGQLVQPGYVMIDNVKHETVEPVYNGTIPINKNTLNQMQDNIEEAINSANVEGIFYWDGKSSDTNPANIELWQKIINKAQEQTVMVFASHENRPSSKNLLGFFILNPRSVTTVSTVENIEGSISYIRTSTPNQLGCYIQFTRITVELTLSSLQVTNVGTIATTTITAEKAFLPTEGTSVTDYTPTHDYHPATKKYVDDAVSSINTSLGSIETILNEINGEVIEDVISE